MRPNSDPSRIKRVGVVVEFQNGRRVMMFSDDAEAQVVLASERQEAEFQYGGARLERLFGPMLHSITVSNLSTYTMQYTEPGQTATAIDGIKNAIEQSSKEEA